MEVASFIVACVALIVSVTALILSVKQAKRTDRIALLSLRIEFYNRLTMIKKDYKILVQFKMMLEAENSEMVFGRGKKVFDLIIGNLGKGEPRQTFEKICSDINFLDVNKNLFNSKISFKIQEIIKILEELESHLTKYLKTRNEDGLQEILIRLSESIDDELFSEIKNIISRWK